MESMERRVFTQSTHEFMATPYASFFIIILCITMTLLLGKRAPKKPYQNLLLVLIPVFITLTIILQIFVALPRLSVFSLLPRVILPLAWSGLLVFLLTTTRKKRWKNMASIVAASGPLAFFTLMASGWFDKITVVGPLDQAYAGQVMNISITPGILTAPRYARLHVERAPVSDREDGPPTHRPTVENLYSGRFVLLPGVQKNLEFPAPQNPCSAPSPKHAALISCDPEDVAYTLVVRTNQVALSFTSTMSLWNTERRTQWIGENFRIKKPRP